MVAALRRIPVTAVYSWWDPGTVPAHPIIDREELHRQATVQFQRIVAPWCEKYPHVEVRTSLVVESPRTALLTAADNAALLVVGRRGHGDSPGPLGSVGYAVVRAAHRPVAVVGSP